VRTLLIAAAIACAVAVGGCKSECARLCDKQAACSEHEENFKTAEKRSELCRSVCESMRSDTEKAPEVTRAAECTTRDCAGFARCVKGDK